MTIAQQLKQWRGRYGLSQSAAAADLGLKLRTLQQYEHGRRQPRGLAASALADRLCRHPVQTSTPKTKT